MLSRLAREIGQSRDLTLRHHLITQLVLVSEDAEEAIRRADALLEALAADCVQAHATPAPQWDDGEPPF